MLAYWTGRSEGDLSALGSAGGRLATDALQVRVRRTAGIPADLAVYAMHQVHGSGVVIVEGGAGAGCLASAAPEADALVAPRGGSCLVVLTADCAPIALGSPEGVHGVVHAGWKGLLAGVVEKAVGAMRELGASEVFAALGPCVHACCYEFSSSDLDQAALRLGGSVRGTTTGGEPAMDLPAGVREALRASGARLAWEADACTACSPEWFSYRASGDVQRQALLVWNG